MFMRTPALWLPGSRVRIGSLCPAQGTLCRSNNHLDSLRSFSAFWRSSLGALRRQLSPVANRTLPVSRFDGRHRMRSNDSGRWTRTAATALLMTACHQPALQVTREFRGVRSGTIEIDGESIHYELLGQGPPLVLIHGGFMDRRVWDDQFGILARHFTTIRYDLPGFGLSPMPRRPRDPSSDLLLLLDHLGVRRAHVVGLSMGGGIALDFAAAHPDRLLRLVVVSSGANGYPVPDADRNRIRAVSRGSKSRLILRPSSV
jgi:hypothetical protein